MAVVNGLFTSKSETKYAAGLNKLKFMPVQ